MVRLLLAVSMLALTFALSGVLVSSPEAIAAKKKAKLVFDVNSGKWVKARPVYRRRAPKTKYKRREVPISTQENPGTIIVDTKSKYLYYVLSNRRAIRYGIGVGKEGFGWDGRVKVGTKKKWPSWSPPPEMVKREWKENKRRVSYMKGGPKNPLGARAIYLYDGKRDTQYRIHGTNEPWSIGLNMSSGCIRMMNKDVEHLYERTKVGSSVIVIGPDGKGRRKVFRPYSNPLAALFN